MASLLEISTDKGLLLIMSVVIYFFQRLYLFFKPFQISHAWSGEDSQRWQRPPYPCDQPPERDEGHLVGLVKLSVR